MCLRILSYSPQYFHGANDDEPVELGSSVLRAGLLWNLATATEHWVKRIIDRQTTGLSYFTAQIWGISEEFAFNILQSLLGKEQASSYSSSLRGFMGRMVNRKYDLSYVSMSTPKIGLK